MRKAVFSLYLLSLVLVTPITGAHAQDTTVFSGGTILTVNSNFDEANAMAVRGNRVLAVGSEEEVKKAAGEEPRLVDLEGKVVLPAFIDAHTHPVAGSATSVFENVGVDRFRSIEDALGHMTDAAAGAGDGDWLLFINADLATQSFDRQEITTEDLDQVSDELPVVLWHAGGHRMTVNTKMLEIMGVAKETPNPPGSEYGRFEDGTPDGNIAGSYALLPAVNAIKPYADFDRFAGVVELGNIWLSQGLGTLGVAGVTSPDDWNVLRKLGDSKDFPLRTRNYLQYASLKVWDDAGIKPGRGDENARVIGYKISVDGSNQAYTGLQRKPYKGRDSKGLPYMMQEQIDEAVLNMSRRGAQMAMHGNGDAGIDNIIEAVEKTRADGVDVIRPRIEHCSIVQDDQLAKLRANDISCSFLIAHVLYWGAAFRDKIFGPERAAKLDRAGSFEREGIPFSLHSDYAVSVLSPLEMIEVAVTRRLFSEPDYVLGEAERASVEGAIRALTSVAAWQLMSEREIGSLEPGKLADFIILDADPRKVEPTKIGEIGVVETWINGQREY